MEKDCLFCKIVAKSISCSKVYEDELIIAFHDINPKAKIHVLVIPKKHIENLLSATKEDKDLLGHLSLAIPDIARSLDLDAGFKLAVHNGEIAGQEIAHLHYHILGN